MPLGGEPQFRLDTSVGARGVRHGMERHNKEENNVLQTLDR